MMKKILIAAAMTALATTASFVKAEEPFWLGADISGTTMMEKMGSFTYNRDSVRTETTKLMKDYGMNATRLRVWVNPKGGFSGTEDVLEMAKRSKALGMPVMIDFHYSDTWADPGKQYPPKAWEGMSVEQTAKALAEHTRSTLQLLKDNDIDVKWVQVGNETTHGFLWPMGKFEDNPKNYAMLTRAGCDAVKEVYPEAKTIIHLDNGFNQKIYDDIFDCLRDNGVKWDIIGMSVYPYWAIKGGREESEIMTLIDSIININHLNNKYGSEIMIVETGVDARNPEKGRQFIDALIKASKHLTNGACTGVFYWAPEIDANANYHLGAFSKGMPTEIMDSFKNASKD